LGRPGWQGVIVIEPDDYLWRCDHVHYDHGDAVRCAEAHDDPEPGPARLHELMAEDERELGSIPEAAKAEVERQWRGEASR
jgi:hypothetical protein